MSESVNNQENNQEVNNSNNSNRRSSSKKSKTMSTFLNSTIRLIKGDDAENDAKNIQTKGIRYITNEITLLKTHAIVEAEDKLADAKAELRLAIANQGKAIKDGVEYVKGVYSASDAVEIVEAEIRKYEADIAQMEAALNIIKE